MDVVPGKLGYVDETVNTADVNKCTEIGNILYNAFNNIVYLDLAKKL